MNDTTNTRFKIKNEITDFKVPLLLRAFAHLFSYLFHPVFIPIYVTLFLLYIHPSAFSGFSDESKQRTLLIIILNLVLFPLITVILLKATGFINSLYLKTQKDRIIPYIAVGIFFFWTYTVFKEQPAYPSILTVYVFGIFLSSSAALLANIYLKVSMHAIGMGGCLGLFFIIMQMNAMLMSWPIALILLITGVVCSSRLLLKSHQPSEIYLGLLIGMISQFMAAFILL